MKYILPVFLLSILLTCGLTLQAEDNAPVDAVPDAVEFAVLKAIYDNLGGATWTTKTNWPISGSWPTSATSAQFDTWYGITVTNGDITAITLGNNNLKGTIPSEIGSLQALNTLNLYSNRGITGSIPSSIGQISTLQYVYLYTCSLTGTIPSSLFDISGLRWVSVADNKLSGSIPSNIGNATALTYIGFHVNDLTGTIPSSICSLANLNSLYLYENALTGSIPSNIGNLSKLINLWLYTNQLTGDIPSSLWNITSLVDLRISTNQLTGSIPSSVKNLINLQTFTLHTNKLTGSIPPEIGSLSKLVNLYLYNNQLTGTIPSSIGNLVNLVYFQIHNNKMSGSLPSSLANLTKVKYFYVNDNQFTGSIPENFSALNQMVTFYIYNNKFSGELPSSVFNGWNKVTAMNISNNQFTGAFPSSVSTCIVLASINALKNQFTSLPSGLLSLPLFNSTNFSYNELTSIPDFTTHVNKANLYFNVSYNRLDFGTLQPLVGAGLRSVVLTPQNTLKDVQLITPVVGSQLSIAGRNAGSNGTVTWEKLQSGGNWISVNTSNENTSGPNYVRNSFTHGDEGTYRLKLTNSSFAGAVIQSEEIKVKTTTGFALDNWAFQYRYDGRRRMTHKKLPGADWVYMVYDDRDRLVLSQDGEQRKSNLWTFTKYDEFNRPIATGLKDTTAGITQAAMQAGVTAHYAKAWAKYGETYKGSAAGNVHGYTNVSYPVVTVAKTNPLSSYSTITYYDSYAFKSYLFGDYSYVNEGLTATVNGYIYKQPAAESPAVIGKVTGTRVKVLDNFTTGGVSTWLATVSYYDDEYRIIQTVADNFRGGINRASILYDFTGNVLQNKNSHYSLRWKDLMAAKRSANRVEKTGTTNAWNTSTGTSVEVLQANQDGWVEFTATDKTKAMMMQLNNLQSTIYQLNLTSGGQIQITESGSSNLISPSPVYVAGDVFRIARSQGKIKFYKNNQQILERTAVSDALSIAFSIYSVGGVVYNIRSSFGAFAQSSVTRSFEYDHAGRLIKTWHQVNDNATVLLASNIYNELGQLTKKNLHGSTNNLFKQQVDYRYNIRGWLTRINDADLSNIDGGPKDFFGMELGYNNDLNIGSFTPQYNGNIGAIKWSANAIVDNESLLPQPTQRAYKFTYDPLSRFLSASHSEKNGTWTESFSYNERVNYDLNGNIVSLDRNDGVGSPMDRLTYNYGEGLARGNQLLSVYDGGTAAGFTDGNLNSDDYTYDATGNLVKDLNKGLSSVKYNSYLNLIEEINKSTGEKIKSIYSAEGVKLLEEIYDAGATSPKTYTHFLGEHVYENDTLKSILHDEGKVIIPSAQSSDASPEYQYQIKDHLDNVRLTFTTKLKTTEFKATMEDNGVSDYSNPRVEEMNYFNNLFETEIRNVNRWLNHTSESSGNSIYLDGSSERTVGPYTILKVYPGDTVRMKVYGKYELKDQYETMPLATLLSVLLTPVNTAVSGEAGTISTSDFASTMGNILAGKSGDDSKPAADLNYILFDKDLNVIAYDFDRIDETAGFPTTGESTVDFDELTLEKIVDRVGYLYVYVSNESPSSRVWMDDLTITKTESPIVQSEDYYPFGLSMNGSAYERGNDRYNGMVTTDGTGLRDLGFRQYDAALGRFHAVDPLAELQLDNSTYHYAGNDPVTQIDVLGLDADVKRDRHRRKQRVKESNGYSRYNGTNTNQSRRDRKRQAKAAKKAERAQQKAAEKGTETNGNNTANSNAQADTKNSSEVNTTKQNAASNSKGSSALDHIGSDAFMEILKQLQDKESNNSAGDDLDKTIIINSVNNGQDNRVIRGGDGSNVVSEKNVVDLPLLIPRSYELASKGADEQKVHEYLQQRHSVNEARALLNRGLVSRNSFSGAALAMMTEVIMNSPNYKKIAWIVEPVYPKFGNGGIKINLDGKESRLLELKIDVEQKNDLEYKARATSISYVSDADGRPEVSDEAMYLFKKASAYVQEQLNAVQSDKSFAKPYLIKQFVEERQAAVQAYLDQLVKAVGDGAVQDFTGDLQDAERKELQNSVDKFKNTQGLDADVKILDDDLFKALEKQYTSGARKPDKDVTLLLTKKADGTFQKHIVYRDGLFVMPTEKVLKNADGTPRTNPDGTPVKIQLTGSLAEVEKDRDKYIDMAIQDNTLDGLKVPEKYKALNVFEKTMWVIKVTKSLLDDIEIKEEHWNNEKNANSWPFYISDPLAGGGNVAIDELKSVPDMVAMGLSLFDKEVRTQVAQSVSELDFNQIKEGLSGMFNDKLENYSSDNPEVVTYQASADGTAIVVAVLTGGTKLLSKIKDVFGNIKKLSKIDWAVIDLPKDKATKLGGDISLSEELNDAIFENPDLAKAWEKLDNAGVDDALRKDADWLKRVDDWEKNGVSVAPDPSDKKLELFSSNGGGKVAEVTPDGKLLPEKYDYPASVTGAPVGQSKNGYQIYKNGDDISVRRVADISEYDANDLGKLKPNVNSHMLERHGADVTVEALQKRATSGFAPDGSRTTRTRNGVNEAYIPPKSSKFNDATSVKKALVEVGPGSTKYNSSKLAAEASGQNSFVVEHDFSTAVGQGYTIPGKSGMNHPISSLPLVDAPVSTGPLTKVKAVYVRDSATDPWYMLTMYPD